MQIRLQFVLMALCAWVISQPLTLAQFGQYDVLDADPKDILSTVNYLLNPLVQKEVGVTSEEIGALRSALDESHGTLSVVSMSEKDVPSSPEEAVALADAIVSERRRNLEEIFDPVQLERLKEISYQIEIATKGIEAALIDGFVGSDIGVKEFEKSGLRVMVKKINEDSYEAFKVRSIESWDEYSRILSFPASETLVTHLGTPQIVRESFFHIQDGHAIPDVGNTDDLLSILNDSAVVNMLQLGDSKAKALRSLRSKYVEDRQGLERAKRRSVIDITEYEFALDNLKKQYDQAIGLDFLSGVRSA